ncbi:class I SAM-dependent methyltransferase [Zooshikella ganghwensis]|uniref:Class I SAM-dependent methyltransferase n=1 Tax=Zooshikella ganghwensis TaxID=202772 RepID=A0A4P9VJZ7_9GAMM|nr:class I SAM-dependent methyltransferase [Zooshikella ganghwensis]RDH42859.1 class I SAM-dependent methyltransferase [Zooshikella ganghwensis]
MSEETSVLIKKNLSAFDRVGSYNQDQINGFDEAFLNQFLQFISLNNAQHVLDAMAGNGNLTHRMMSYCHHHNIKLPSFTLLEYSSVQTELARTTFNEANVNIINGDVLTMSDRISQQALAANYFDRVVIKSGNHEIPFAKQFQLYKSIFNVLKPGGVFINLGFLFSNQREREEFTQITRVKDNLIGATDSVTNRYFLLRHELYSLLHEVGFNSIECSTAFNYSIHSDIVENEYFPENSSAIKKIIATQQQAKMLLKNKRIKIDKITESSTMYLPGEITIATKPVKP